MAAEVIRGQVSFRHRAGTAAAVVAGLMGACSLTGTARAQDAEGPQTSSGLEEVIVTARRVEENVQRVPIAVNVFVPEKLAELDIKDVPTLMRNVPGVSVCCSAFNNAGLTFVRGIQNSAPSYFADAPVNTIGFANFFDISSVQVLKGPQGTLFGQASAAGAFVYQPRRPADRLGGYVSLVGGNYGRRTLEGAIDLPLADGRLLTRLAVITSRRDGYIKNLANNTYYANEDYYVVRPSVIWKITDNLENYTMAQYSYAQNNGFSSALWVLDDFNFGTQYTPSLQNALTALNGGNLAAFNALKDQMLARQRQLGRYTILGTSTGCNADTGPVFSPYSAANPITSINHPDVSCGKDWFIDRRIVNITTYSLSEDWAVKNILHHNTRAQLQSPSDFEFSPLLLNDSGSPRNIRSPGQPEIWTNELQLQGSVGRFDLTSGIFYRKQDQDTGITFTTANTNTTASRTVSALRTKAAYAQGNIHITEPLTVTLGARYTEDTIEQTAYNINPNTLAVIATVGGPGRPNGEAKFTNTSYTAGLQYQFSPETMFFFTNSRGYNAGGLQNVVGYENFKPSVLTNYELGVKSTFDLGSARARVNASVFYGKFDDVQVFVYGTYTSSVTGATTPSSATQNAAKATIEGFEGEFTIAPTDSLELGAFGNYLKNEYTHWPSINPLNFQPVDLSNTPFLYVPKWKYGARATYYLPFPESIGRISVSADFTHRDQMINTIATRTPLDPNNPSTGLICTRQRTAANGYGPLSADGGTSYIDCVQAANNVDMGAQWRSFLGHESVSLNLTVSNVTNNKILDSQANLERSSGFTSRQPAAPRMYSLRVRYEF